MNKELCVEYLKNLAFSDEEVEEFLPKLMYALPILGISEEDLKFSMNEWLPQNWDMEYLGVKKLMGATLRETVDIAHTKKYKEEGVKIVYGILPAIQTNYTAIKEAGGDKVFVSFVDHWLLCGLQMLFHKFVIIFKQYGPCGRNDETSVSYTEADKTSLAQFHCSRKIVPVCESTFSSKHKNQYRFKIPFKKFIEEQTLYLYLRHFRL